MRRDIGRSRFDFLTGLVGRARVGLPLFLFAAAALAADPTCGGLVNGTTAEATFSRELQLDAGCSYVVEVRQYGADVVVSIVDPTGRSMLRANSPTGRIGTERVAFKAPIQGMYQLRTEPAVAQGTWGRVDWAVRPITGDVFDGPAREAMKAETEAANQYAIATPESREAAAKLYRRAVQHWNASKLRGQRATAQLSLAWIEYAWLEDWQGAAALARQAHDEFNAREDVVSAASAKVLGALAELELAQIAKPGDQVQAFEQVIRDLRDAVARFKRLQLRYEEVFAQNNVGLAKHYQGASGEAVQIFRQCADEFAAMKESAQTAMARQNVGWVRIEQGNYSDARVDLQQALDDMTGVDDPRQRLAILNNYALVESTLGNYEQAIRINSEARELARSLGDDSEQARALHGLGVAYVRAGNRERAVRYFQQALPMRTPGRGRISTLLALGNLLRANGDNAAAIALHEEARSLASLPLDVAKTYVAVGEDLLAQRELPRALAAFESAASQETNEYNEIVGVAQVGRGRALLLLDRPKEALAALSIGIDIHTRNQSFVYAADGYALRARLYRALGDVERARRDIDAAVALSERGRARLANPDIRTTYLAARSGILEEKLQQLTRAAADGASTDSLLAMERWRAAGLRDRLSVTLIGTPAEMAERRRIQDELVSASFQLDQARDRGRPHPQRIAAIDARIVGLETALDGLAGGRVLTQPRLQFDRAGLQRIQARLNNDSVLAYFTGEESSWRWTITSRDVTIDRLPKREALRQLLAETLPCYSTLVSGSRASDCARRMQDLSSTLLPTRGISPRGLQLTIVPDGLLSAVPFAALNTPDRTGRYLIDTYAVAVAPALSMSSLATPPSRSRSTMTLGVVADPVYSLDDPRLPKLAALSADDAFALVRIPGSGQEALAVAGAWKTQAVVLAGLDARRDAVLDGFIGRFDVLHFATHVTLNDKNSDLSRIELSRYDGQRKAQASAVAPRDFRGRSMRTDLVVLSGCESGLGMELGSEGVLGFQQSLMSAGVKNVVASLWRVSDRSAQLLMTQFYQSLGSETTSYRTAVREAQLRLRASKGYSHPYHWAAFQLYSMCVSC